MAPNRSNTHCAGHQYVHHTQDMRATITFKRRVPFSRSTLRAVEYTGSYE